MVRKPGLYICPKCGRIKSGDEITCVAFTMMCNKCMVMMVEVSPTAIWRRVKRAFEDKIDKRDKGGKSGF